MHVVILALGSRGDVQPFVALALVLQERGHRVTVAAAADYGPLAAAYGVPFAPVGGYVVELMNMGLVNELLDGAHNPLYFARAFLGELAPLLTTILADCWQIAQQADLLIVSTLGLYLGLDLVEKRPCPLVAVHFHPLLAVPDRAHVNFPSLPPWLPLAAPYHQMTHWLGRHGLWQLLGPMLNRARRTVLQLPPLSPWARYRRAQQPVPTLFAYSPTVAPLPSRYELPPATAITGYWFLPQPPAWQPPTPLLHFLAAGPPPVVITFGSILGGRDPNAMTHLLVDALGQSGQRGLIYRGWGDLGNIKLPPTVLAIDATPHDWLFARCAAVVHHGGAGTTAATLRAGLPSVVVPVFGDQLLWGERLHALNVAPPPLPRRHLTGTKLAVAIRQAVTNPTFQANAQSHQRALQAEAGPACAVAWLARHFLLEE
jgi:UDP:flavonoid glycosyltransferase YjiC (YdhE family)